MRGRGARRLARAGRVGALEIVATRTAPEPLTFGSTAAVSMSSPADPDPADNTASVTTTYVPTGDLRLTLDGTAGPLNEGESLVWTFTLGNLGPNETARVALAQSLPSGFALGTVATTHGLCTPSPASLDCALGTLAPGTTVTVVVSGAPAPGSVGTTLATTATASSSDRRPDAGRQHRLGLGEGAADPVRERCVRRRADLDYHATAGPLGFPAGTTSVEIGVR